MSEHAPWLALSIDWMDSPMFDEATHGERLAWVCLLCYAKSNGRGGKVRLRKNALQTTFRLSERAVSGMLDRARKCAAIEVNGDFVTLCNWDTYQGKAASAKYRARASIPETTPTGQDQAHITKDQAQGFDRFWLAWPKHHRKSGKAVCFDQWAKAGLEAIADRVVDGVERWKRSKAWAEDNGKYIPLPATWLNQRRWEDDDLVQVRVSSLVSAVTQQQALEPIVGADGKIEYVAAKSSDGLSPEERKAAFDAAKRLRQSGATA